MFLPNLLVLLLNLKNRVRSSNEAGRPSKFEKHSTKWLKFEAKTAFITQDLACFEVLFDLCVSNLKGLPASLEFLTLFFMCFTTFKRLAKKKKFWNWLFSKKKLLLRKMFLTEQIWARILMLRRKLTFNCFYHPLCDRNHAKSMICPNVQKLWYFRR